MPEVAESRSQCDVIDETTLTIVDLEIDPMNVEVKAEINRYRTDDSTTLVSNHTSANRL